MKILVIKIAALGDIAMALPLAKSLKSKYPQSQLTWIVGRSCAQLLAETKIADRILIVDDKALLTGSFFAKAKVTLGLLWKLKFQNFDLAFNLHLDRRYWFFLKAASVRSRRQFRTTPGRSLSESFLFLIGGEEGPLEYTEPSPCLDRGTQRSRTIGIAPGGAKNIARDNALRRWPIENYQAVVQALISKGHEVVILGAPSDDWIIPFFSKLPVRLEIGTMSMPKFLDELSALRVLITHDSGPLHLANLVGTPVVACFGPTPASSFFPRRNQGTSLELSPKLPCQPCYDGVNYANCSQNLCLQRITPAAVIDAFNVLDRSLDYEK